MAVAQEPTRSSDFGQTDIATAAEDIAEAQKAWRQASRNLEQEVFRLPMAEARARVQSALNSAMLVLDQRQRYGEKVAGNIDKSHDGAYGGARRQIVSVEIVSRDELEVLDANLTELVAKLETLRSSPQEWLKIRRGVQTDQSAITAMQSKLREDIPVDMLFRPAAPEPMSAIVYRDAEKQLREVLQKTWVHYYQGVIDAAEQKTGGSAPLMSILSPAAGTPAAPAGAPAAPVAAPAAPAANALAGTWGYLEGTQQFNGVAEPHQVLLELWMEGGNLLGRYRGEIPDFDGVRKVDLRLRAKTGKTGQIILQIQGGDPVATGEFIVEDPGAGGLNIMLVRAVGVTGPIPRGRELLTRR
jgi:hypothetical protein